MAEENLVAACVGSTEGEREDNLGVLLVGAVENLGIVDEAGTGNTNGVDGLLGHFQVLAAAVAGGVHPHCIIGLQGVVGILGAEILLASELVGELPALFQVFLHLRVHVGYALLAGIALFLGRGFHGQQVHGHFTPHAGGVEVAVCAGEIGLCQGPVEAVLGGAALGTVLDDCICLVDSGIQAAPAYGIGRVQSIVTAGNLEIVDCVALKGRTPQVVSHAELAKVEHIALIALEIRVEAREDSRD